MAGAGDVAAAEVGEAAPAEAGDVAAADGGEAAPAEAGDVAAADGGEAAPAEAGDVAAAEPDDVAAAEADAAPAPAVPAAGRSGFTTSIYEAPAEPESASTPAAAVHFGLSRVGSPK